MPPPNHHPPVMGYKGLTIVLNKPSRFDTDRLISGRAGDYFNNILQPLNRHNCDIRTISEITSLLEGTKLTVLLGQESLSAVKPGYDLRTVRGNLFEKGGHLYLPTFTPQDSFDRKNYENPESKDDDKEDDGDGKDFQKTQRKNFRFWMYNDIRKAIRLVQFGPRAYPKVNYHIYPPSQTVIEKLQTTKGQNLVIDIETDPQLNITCFGFLFYPYDELRASHTIEVFVIPVKRFDCSFGYDKISLAKIFQALQHACNYNLVIGHNLSFDLFVNSLNYKIAFPRRSYCTMIGAHRLNLEVEKSLGHCISLFTDLPFHKDEGIFNPKNHEQEQQLWQYNGKDIATTLFVYLGQRAELLKRNALESAVQGSNCLRTYLTMQYIGMKVDTDRLCKMIQDFDRQYNDYQRLLNLLTGRNLNPRSSQQVGEYLYEKLRLPKPTTDLTGEDNLHKAYIISGAPSIRVILAMREIGTLRSKLTNTILWKESRLTCAYKITGSDMHRLGSSALLSFKGHFKGWGTNCQNYSKKIRDIVVADPGKLLFKIDQSGADAKIVAYLCISEKFRTLFTQGIKPHTYVAMHIVPQYWADRLGVADISDYIYSPIETLKTLKYWKDLATLIADSDNSVNPQERYYYIGKQMCHSLNYDATWTMFQMIALKKSDGALRLTNEVCQKYVNLYRQSLFPELTTWHEEVKQIYNSNNRTLRNLFGYPRQFNTPWGHELFKQMYAYIPQSTVAVISHLCATEVQERIDNKEALFEGVDLLQNEHDSIMGQAPIEKVYEVAKAMRPHIERNLVNFRGEKFQMGSGLSVGYRWCPESKKNPDGLKELKWSEI